ncbi:MAG: MFS transporter, partial [Bacteroidota bacterium]
CGMLYTIWLTVFGFLLLRIVHGFSTGFTPTATSTYVADVTPRERLGEAMGIQGIAFSIGLAIGPAIGSFVRLYFDYVGLFLTSSSMALFSMLLLWRLPETLVEKKPFSLGTLKISRKEILSKDALPAGIVTLFTYVSLGVVLTLIPDWSGHLGVENRGTFFIVFALASLLVRFAAGSFSDRYGRTTVIFVGLLMLLATNIYLGVTRTPTGLLFAAALYGFAAGSISPALNAWTIDLSKPQEKGRGMATMYIGLEAGIGLGALLSGWYYQGEIAKIPNVWFACALTTTAGLFFVVFYARKYRRLKHEEEV